MSDLIERSEAVDLVRKMQTYKLSANADFLLVDQAEVMMELMLLPPAQPERKRGKWILKPNIYGVAYCSECDYELHTNNTNFCPNCGIDMRGEQDD